MTIINTTQAEQLLQLARRAIEAQLLGDTAAEMKPSEPVFFEKAATFVTLKMGDMLRGCIGSLEPLGSLWDNVRSNAVNAAFHDSRFLPLSREELDKLHIEISVLTRPEVLEYADGNDLIARLRPGIDGVVLRQGRAGATFLPQVWEQLPQPELFLGHLCRKAGLYENCWKEDHPRIELYQVQHFEEKR